MHPNRDEVIRVGLRLVIVALVAALLVLLLSPSARSEQAGATEQEARLLEPVTPLSAAERAERAETLLHDEQRRRVGNLVAHALDLGIRVAFQASPRRLFGALSKLGRDINEWRGRSHAEDRALALLEAERRAGTLDESALDLYQDLDRRERDARSDQLLDEAELALETGRSWRAQQLAQRALALGEDVERAQSLLDRAEARDEVSAKPARRTLEIERGELPLALALLTENDARVQQLAGDGPDAALARAVASYASGRRSESLAELARLAEFDNAAGASARAWLDDPRLNPTIRFDRESSDFKRRRAFGWIGGTKLADSGFDLSLDGFDAWKDSFSPLNLAVAAPSRALRGWQPDPSELRQAADRYLEVLPDGPRAGEARHWLASLRVDPKTARRSVIWDDGVLVLPTPETDFTRRAPRPILIAIGSLGRARFEALGLRLDGADAVLLTPLVGEQTDVLELPSDTALALLGELAAGLESRALATPLDQTSGAVLEALRRLDVGVREGMPVAVEPWIYVDQTRTTVSLNRALDAADDEPRSLTDYVRSLGIVRGGEDLKMSRAFSAQASCPERTYCIDRTDRVSGALHARVDVDGDLSLGAQSRLASASFSVELSRSGADASLSLPIARWLGLGRWLPVEANVGVGLDGISVGTQPSEPEPAAAAY